LRLQLDYIASLEKKTIRHREERSDAAIHLPLDVRMHYKTIAK